MGVEDKPIIIMGDAFSIDSLAEIVANEVFWDGVSLVHLNVDRRAIALNVYSIQMIVHRITRPLHFDKKGKLVPASITNNDAKAVLAILKTKGAEGQLKECPQCSGQPPILKVVEADAVDLLARLIASKRTLIWNGCSTLLTQEDGDILPLTDRDVIHLAGTLASPVKKIKRGWVHTRVTKSFAKKVLVLLNTWGRSQSGRASSTIAVPNS